MKLSDLSVFFTQWITIVGVIFVLFQLIPSWIFKSVFYNQLQHRKIFPERSSSTSLLREFKSSLVTQVVYFLTGCLIYLLYEKGVTLIYSDFLEQGLVYALFSFFVIHTLQDTYFYWTHRALHEISFLKPLHRVHHQSRIPSAMAAASFSLGEAFIHSLFYVMIIFLIPVHPFILVGLFVFLSFMSAMGHTEFEFWPNGIYRIPYACTFNTLTSHNLHHFYGHGNYSLYYRFWDDLCGTAHPKTSEHFYIVQRNIAGHLGRAESVRRPQPSDQMGLYFEELLKYNEDIRIFLNSQPLSPGLHVLKKEDFRFFEHRYCDGISAVKLYHQELHHPSPQFSDLRKSKLQWNSLFSILGRLIRSFPYRGYQWKNSDSLGDAISTLVFSQASTEELVKKLKVSQISMNEFLVSTILQSTKDDILVSKWLIPSWYPKSHDHPEAAPISNHASFFEIDFSQNMSEQEFSKQYRHRLKSIETWFWAKSFSALNLGMKIFFKPLVFLSHRGLKRSGTISNLGSIRGMLSAPLLFVPPALMNAPVAFGIVTYNDQLTISVHSCKRLGPGTNQQINWLKKIQECCLSKSSIN